MDVFLDIETLPCADPVLIAEISSRIKPPGTLRKAESIQKWEIEERPQAVADACARSSLDGAFGRLCIIGWAIDDAEPQVLVTENETELLTSFFAEIVPILEPHDGHPPSVRWIGHNLVGFDLPFMRKRCVVNGICPPTSLRLAMSARPWDANVADTMLMWDSERDKRIGLDLLCKVLGIQSPKADGIDGSKVAGLFSAGEYGRLGEYCSADVIATRACFRAMTWGRQS